jgi:hypothetical protein
MNEMYPKELITKLAKIAQEIDRTSKANWIHLSEEFIQTKADEGGVAFDEMVKIIENQLEFKIQTH